MKIFLFMATAWAQEHGAEHVGEAISIPWMNIFVQALNFSILLGVLAYVLRKSVKQHFAQRAADYRELVDRAEQAKRDAEKHHNQIAERLSKLETSSEQGIAKARSDAEDLRKRLIAEAKSLAQKLETEAQRTTAVELEKAKAELRKELLEKALAQASENLGKSLGSSDQKKLQNEFVAKIEVVGG